MEAAGIIRLYRQTKTLRPRARPSLKNEISKVGCTSLVETAAQTALPDLQVQDAGNQPEPQRKFSAQPTLTDSSF